MDEKKRNEQSIPSDKAAELTDKMLDSVTGGFDHSHITDRGGDGTSNPRTSGGYGIDFDPPR